MSVFRVSQRGGGIDDADTLEGAREVVRGQPPGRYDVDEISREPLPSGHTSRQWGRMIRHPDGRVEGTIIGRRGPRGNQYPGPGHRKQHRLP